MTTNGEEAIQAQGSLQRSARFRVSGAHTDATDVKGQVANEVEILRYPDGQHVGEHQLVAKLDIYSYPGISQRFSPSTAYISRNYERIPVALVSLKPVPSPDSGALGLGKVQKL